MAKNNLEDKIKQLKQLREEYEKISKMKAPDFSVKNIDQANKAIKDMTMLIGEAKDDIELLEGGFIGIHKSLSNVTAEMAKTNKHASNVLKTFNGVEGVVKTLKYDQEGLEKLTKKQLELQKTKFQKLQNEAKLSISLLKDQKIGNKLQGEALDKKIESLLLAKELTEQEAAMIRAGESEISVFNDINKLLEDRIRTEKAYENALGITGATAKSLKGILNTIGAGALADRLGIDDALKNAEESAKTLVDSGKKITIGDKIKIATNFAKDLGKGLLKSLGPLALITGLIKKVMDAFHFLEHASGEVAKEYGISAVEAEHMVAHANKTAMHSKDILVSTKDIVAAQMELNKIFGSSVEFSGEFAAEFASIKERAGLSSEAMGFFANQALMANTSIEKQLENVVGMTMELNAQNGVSMNRKEIEESMGKLTSAQVLTAKKNTKELVNQVFQAKMLGMELKEVEGIAQGLLDFESSIQAEMEAELLTGRQLNLETARQAALQGDLATVAKEVAAQMGSAEEFGKMNVIQQEALAKSVGMTRESLADALMEQEKHEALRKSGFKDMSDAQNQYNEAMKNGTMTEELSNKLKQAGVLEQMESVTSQEKMAAILEKIQSLFISIAEPLMAIITPIVDILAPILGTIVSTLGYVLEGIKKLGPALLPIIGLFGILWARAKADAIMSVISNVWKSLGGLPVVGPVLAAAAIAGGIGFINSQKMKDGVIGPGGEMVVSGPKGSIQLDKEDSLIAGTDLGGKKNKKSDKSEKSTQSIDLSPVIAELNAMKTLLAQLIEKKGDVYIDGAKAGYSLTLADSKMG